MSERGIEIHNGEVIIPAMETAFSVGTRDSPITQSDATLQQVLGAFINTSALGIGWDIHGVWGWVNCAVDRDGDIVGVEGRCYVNAGIQIGGNVFGMHSRVYALGAAILDKDIEGLHIYMNVDPLSTITGNAAAIYVENNMRKDPVGRYDIVKLREDGLAVIDALLYTRVGAAGNINYFLETSFAKNAWGDTGQPTYTTNYGWIKVKIAGVDRWILLYDTAP